MADHSPAKPNSVMGTPSMDGTGDSTPLRDAGSRKVRGPDGRYVNKDDPTPPAMKKTNIKYVKKCKYATDLNNVAAYLAYQIR
jgi:hypothetical protein